ncbi:MAG: hypothetical protein QF805_24770 [Pirellulaceae bacterium]|jgi:hypothetical protein|nr:hypothetical protein [Pirellulaceae bacterium]
MRISYKPGELAEAEEAKRQMLKKNPDMKIELCPEESKPVEFGFDDIIPIWDEGASPSS